jgi:Ca2+/Na+ antiporter
VYAVLLALGAKLIANGSEYIMEVADAGLVGGLLLPILGAIPDAAIVGFSVFGGGRNNSDVMVQSMNVGIGTLAGSNVMMLCLGVCVTLLSGRCDLSQETGVAIKSQCASVSLPSSLFKQGITVYRGVCNIARMMLVTLLPLLIVAISSLLIRDCDNRRWAAIAALVAAGLTLAVYTVFVYRDSMLTSKLIRETRRKHVWHRFVADLGSKLAHATRVQVKKEKAKANIEGVTTPLADGTHDRLFPSRHGGMWMPQRVDHGALRRHVQFNVDLDASSISRLHSAPAEDDALLSRHVATNTDHTSSMSVNFEDSPDDDARGNRRLLALKGMGLICAGLLVTIIFSDTLIQSILAIAARLKIPPFTVAFLLVPLITSGGDLVATFQFAKSKSRKTASLAIGQILGGVAMTNTISLGVFLLLLATTSATASSVVNWSFTAEAIAVVAVVVPVGLLFAFNETLRLLHVIWIMLLIPSAVVFVLLAKPTLIDTVHCK